MPSLLDRLIALYPLAKRQTFKQMLISDRIRVDGKRVRNLQQQVADNAAVEVRPKQRDPEVRSPRLPFDVIFEDDDLLVIDKPAGLLTSTTAREKRPTAWAAVRQYVLNQTRAGQPGLIHRLDRDASGLLVFSKSAGAYRSLKTQFFHHTVDRVYAAVVHGRVNPDRGRIDSFLDERADGTVYSKRNGGGQRAITDYETVRATNRFTLLNISLLTGRKHQIRVHLSQRGNPIVGDKMYGSSSEINLSLRAIELQFDHPADGKRVKFKTEIADEMLSVIDAAG